MRRTILGTLLAVLSIPSCGGPDPVSLDEYVALLPELACARVYQCCDDAERAMIFSTAMPPITDRAGCEAWYTGFAGSFEATVRAELESGLVTWDENAAGECLATYDQDACGGPMLSSATVCSQVLRGTLPDGSACTSATSCISQTCSSGMCVTRPGEGEPCELSCDTGLFCDDSGVCRRQLAGGGACTSATQCQSFMCVEGTCATGAFCDGT